MVRTQIQLTETQAALLKRRAAERGESMAAVIRELVDQGLREPAGEDRWRRALSVVGKYDSGLTDIAENHDEYLAEAFQDW